jgi:hypothetical protein
MDLGARGDRKVRLKVSLGLTTCTNILCECAIDEEEVRGMFL